jgi:hypothetical protein
LPTIFDPTDVSRPQRQPFLNNQIPSGHLDPVAVAFLAQIPLPNLPGTAQNLRSAGSQRINAVIGPGLQEFDLSLQKDIRLKEATKLQFRAEAYNLFNHPNFNIPNRVAFTSNFGSISSAQDSRQLPLALKLAF